MKLEEVRGCLENDGWPIEVVSDTTLRTRFRGGDRVFPVFVHQEPEHFVFAVIPFVHLPGDESARDAIAEKLLRYNRDMNMAKFSIDEDGDVILSVEYRAEDLDPSEVRDAVDVLSYYAEKYRADVQRMSSV